MTVGYSRLKVVTLELLLLGGSVLSLDCTMEKGGAASGPTQADRLIHVYPELKSGRFAVIADFEDARHMDLFQLIGVSERAKCVLDRKGGRPQTGRQCLSVTAGSSDDVVVVGNVADGEWHLKRDWRPYDLLLLSVRSPASGLTLNLSIVSGQAENRLSAQSSIRLEKDWNVLRFDLSEIGELIPLDDIQQLRISLEGVGQTAQVRFDDLVLTGNREELFGESRNTMASLYAQRVGRRLNVGAGGRFELTFANGQITHWYNLVSDPNRLRNLVQGTTLGPSPMIVDEHGAPAGDSSALGRSVATRQRLIEASAVRVVIASEWRSIDDPAAQSGDRPFQEWLFTIYPTGQIYVVTKATTQTQQWNPDAMGLALTVAGGEGEWSSIDAESGVELPKGAAVLRNPSANAAIVWAMAPASARIVEHYDPVTKRLSLVALDEASADPVRRWTCHVFLSDLDGLSNAETVARAAEYQSPRAPRLEVGFIAPNAVGARPGQSFHWSEGCHAIAPEAGRVRLVVQGGERPTFTPAFRIVETAGTDCWVYVDHLVLKEVGRDRNGELLFQLPKTVTKRTLVEVFSRPPAMKSLP